MSGAMHTKSSRRLMPALSIGGGAVLLVMGSLLFVFLAMWVYLAISLMPRPWQIRTAPLPLLHAAVDGGDMAAVVQALDAGASVDSVAVRNRAWPDGTTPLMIAVRKGRSDIAQLLLERGADVGLSPVARDGMAIHWTSAESLDVLLRFGADLEARDASGRTPLIVAAARAQVRGGLEIEVVRALLRAGADRGARDHQGRTALDAVRLRPNPVPELVELLSNVE